MGCGMYPTLSSTCWAVAGTARLAPSARLPPPTVLRKVRRLISSPPLLLREEGSSLAGSAARPPSRRECGLPSLHCQRSEEHTSELQSRFDLVCRLLLEKKKKQ